MMMTDFSATPGKILHAFKSKHGGACVFKHLM
jgi:hypothetical protein